MGWKCDVGHTVLTNGWSCPICNKALVDENTALKARLQELDKDLVDEKNDAALDEAYILRILNENSQLKKAVKWVVTTTQHTPGLSDGCIQYCREVVKNTC